MQRHVRRALAALGALAALVFTLSAGSTTARASPVRVRGAPSEAPRPAPARTVVTFTWGGGLADQMGALPVFRHYGMHATFYVPSGLGSVATTRSGRRGAPPARPGSRVRRRRRTASAQRGR